MKNIGGNLVAELQIKTSGEKNAIGERITQWETIQRINGFLDLSSGEAKYTVYDAKIQESTHLFISKYVTLDERISAENSRMLINNQKYDITLIDNPMNLNKHLEFFLKYTGGQNGN